MQNDTKKMIGMVLVTHGHLANELRAALEHVVGSQQAIETVSIRPSDNMENRRDDILSAIKKAEQGKGVIVLTDMFGGTPSNLSISAMQPGKIEVIAGVNLPLLVKLASIRKTKTVAEAVLEAQEAGRKYIHVASSLLTNTTDQHSD